MARSAKTGFVSSSTTPTGFKKGQSMKHRTIFSMFVLAIPAIASAEFKEMKQVVFGMD
jgi:hypothetical protein